MTNEIEIIGHFGLWLSGGLVGFYTKIFIDKYYAENYYKNKYVNPFKEFLKKNYTYEFSHRNGKYVYINYKEGQIILNIIKHEIYIYDKEENILFSSDVDQIKKDITELYKEICARFVHEIYTDVIKLNGIFYSKHLYSQENLDNNTKINLDLDDILDKINNQGIESLTEEEINYLKNKS